MAKPIQVLDAAVFGSVQPGRWEAFTLSYAGIV